ncbi:hypothetical protein HK104_000320 [Borealophlyctis nickersoniae]|nr:hypothetical protein HK104_000320 [Borealophlyctis nickersoniae]
MSDKIQEGDYVGTKFRGGTHQGYAESVEGGKCTFTDQHGHKVTHNISTLAKDPDRSASTKDLDEEEKEEIRRKWREEIGK